MKVKIIGAGSIGNHHAQASRIMGWDVTVVDTDPQALERMKNDIYPKRYGEWDDAIQLAVAGTEPVGGFDVIYLGTPPHVRLSVAQKALTENPKVLQLEKPLCPPTKEALEELKNFSTALKAQPSTMAIVGFNHLVAENTRTTESIMAEHDFGAVVSIDAGVRSHWQNIFKAHPWLSGPEDTYLGYWKKGGGAGGEHSHALSLWQHFAHTAGVGRVTRVQGLFEYVHEKGAEYDRHCLLQLTTSSGLVGRVIQDVVTQPKKKWIELQFEKGRIEWWNDVTKSTDEVIVQPASGDARKIVIEKTRIEEFLREAEHIDELISGKAAYVDSPIRFERGADTAVVLAAAHQSHAESRTVNVEYSAV